jgi:DnaD/phage-associated family protein
MLFDDDEVGKYIRTMCYQHQHGHIPQDKMEKLCKGNANVMEKFIKDQDGKYYNERLDLEINRRSNFLDKQRENGAKGGRPKNPNKTQTKASLNPNLTLSNLEDEDEEENNISNIYSYIEKIYGRTLTSTECIAISDWQEKFSDEMIEYAFDLSVSNNAPKLKYVQAIINNWTSSGYKTLDDVKKHDSRSIQEELKLRPKIEIPDYNWLEDKDE